MAQRITQTVLIHFQYLLAIDKMPAGPGCTTRI